MVELKKCGINHRWNKNEWNKNEWTKKLNKNEWNKNWRNRKLKNPRSVRITHAGSWGYVKKGVFGGGGVPPV